jgi:hypothetical protein
MVDEATKAKIIEEYLNNATGRKHLADTMIAPIRRRLYANGFYCGKCQMEWDDAEHVHSEEECNLYAIHGS